MQMHWVLLAVGVVLDLIGTIWLLQGINLLPGSFMTGQPFWAVAGLVAMIAGLGLIILAMRRKAEHG
jgi:LPXTG-motif cell wall-anchored protein